MTDPIDRFVHVEMKHQALREPQFIVKSGSVYYLTMAVWPFDPAAEGRTPAQDDGVQQIKQLFERLEKDGHHRDAVEIPEAKKMAFTGGHTINPT